MTKAEKTPIEMADLIERFLSNKLIHRGEWYDFVDCSHLDPKLDSFRKQCAFFSDQLSSDERSLDLSRDDRWQDARMELKAIAAQLREIEENA